MSEAKVLPMVPPSSIGLALVSAYSTQFAQSPSSRGEDTLKQSCLVCLTVIFPAVLRTPCRSTRGAIFCRGLPADAGSSRRCSRYRHLRSHLPTSAAPARSADRTSSAEQRTESDVCSLSPPLLSPESPLALSQQLLTQPMRPRCLGTSLLITYLTVLPACVPPRASYFGSCRLPPVEALEPTRYLEFHCQNSEICICLIRSRAENLDVLHGGSDPSSWPEHIL